jgi:hypothetical protein
MLWPQKDIATCTGGGAILTAIGGAVMKSMKKQEL